MDRTGTRIASTQLVPSRLARSALLRAFHARVSVREDLFDLFSGELLAELVGTLERRLGLIPAVPHALQVRMTPRRARCAPVVRFPSWPLSGRRTC